MVGRQGTHVGYCSPAEFSQPLLKQPIYVQILQGMREEARAFRRHFGLPNQTRPRFAL